MRRRTLLVGAGALLGAAATAIGLDYLLDRPDYRGDARVVTDHGSLALEPTGVSVPRGETVEFVVENTSDEDVILGCQNPWALQRRDPWGWTHVCWTAMRYHYQCATVVGPDETYVERVTLSTDWLAEATAAEPGSVDLSPGRYRFVVLGVEPFLATEFDLVEPA